MRCPELTIRVRLLVVRMLRRPLLRGRLRLDWLSWPDRLCLLSWLLLRRGAVGETALLAGKPALVVGCHHIPPSKRPYRENISRIGSRTRKGAMAILDTLSPSGESPRAETAWQLYGTGWPVGD